MNLVKMDDETFNLCLNLLELKTLKKNDYFIEQEKKCTEIAYINNGLFRIYYLKNGIEINTCFCLEDSIISSFESFISNGNSTENIQAVESSEIVILSKKNLSKLYKLNSKWKTLSQVLTEKECLRLSNRVNNLSFETASKKYQQLLKNQPEIIKRVPVQHIASYLGISRETLSRIRAKIL
jgi:CRP-like cAMP-binding protein